HAKTRSPRAVSLFRELSAKFNNSGVDPIIAKAARRAEALKIPWMRPVTEHIRRGQRWMSQMIRDEENQAWDRLAAGLVNGLEAQIDLWIQATFGIEQSQVYMLRRDGAGSAMTWSVLDDQLKSLGPKTLQRLRKFQEERCLLDPRSIDLKKATQTEKLALFRRFPWAKTAHRGLMDYAQKELEAGRGQSAQRAFRDLLEHGEDPVMLGRSRVGTWLATALGQEYGKLAELIAEVGPAEKFPWMDKTVTAGEIKERLMKGVTLSTPKQQSPALSDLDIQFLKMPARPLWPQMNNRRSPGLAFADLQSVGSRLLVSTRNVLAWYEAKEESEPVWTDTSLGGQRDRSIGRLGSFRPIIHGNRIYTRWGYEADPRQLVAIDAETREILWNQDVAGPKEARRRIPLGNPVLSGGQIYLAAAWDQHRSTGGYNLRLSNVDAATGKVNWRADLYVQAMQRFFEGVLGESLTIHDGAIYCSPSTGFLARFDARDGKMEWMYTYQSVPSQSLLVDTLGTAPHVVGDVVVGLPRDTNVMFGLDRRTGEVIWRSSLLLPKKIIGSVEGKVLVHGVFTLAAVDARTGKIHWKVTFPDKILARPTLQGSSVYLSSGSNFYRYDATTGIELETRPLPVTKNSIRNVSAIGDKLYLITNEPNTEKENPFVRKATGDAAWEVTARDPKLYLPKENESSKGEILLHEDEMLHCLEATPEGKVLWQRFVYPRPNEVLFVEGKVVLFYHKGRYDLYLKALDQKTGNLEWELTLLRLRAGHGAAFGRSGKYLYGKDNSDRFLLVDLSLGKVVLRNRINRRNGHVKAGFGGGKVQFFVTPAYHRSLYWLRWDIVSGELEGSEKVLKGRDGDPNKAFENNWVEFAKFGSHACYFISRQEGSGREYVAYRADYKDGSVHLVGRNTRTLKFEPPFLFMQQQETDQNRKNRTHPWAIQRED
ncbi:MAG: PQQ-binding-like beta-propeller repeat protein, partial [Opitutales bacterium]